MVERITAHRVAEITGYSARHILRLAKAGMVPSAAQLVPGGPWTFREAAVRKWVADAEAKVARTAQIRVKPIREGLPEPMVDEDIDAAFERSRRL